MNISIEEKKAEAINRMKRLGIFSETVKQFEKDDKVSISEPPVGAFYWAEGEDLDRIRQFEGKRNALVYVVIRSYTTIGKMDAYLFVSDHRDEWEEDNEAIVTSGTSEMMAYVFNHDMPDCSEMGYIGVNRTLAAGLRRTW